MAVCFDNEWDPSTEQKDPEYEMVDYAKIHDDAEKDAEFGARHQCIHLLHQRTIFAAERGSKQASVCARVQCIGSAECGRSVFGRTEPFNCTLCEGKWTEVVVIFVCFLFLWRLQF